MRVVAVTVEGVARASAETAFDTVVPIDLPSIFTGYGPFPAVTGVSLQAGAWDAAGKSRSVLLRGGGVMRERLVEVERPIRCGYEVLPTKGPLRLLVERIHGQWVFREVNRGTTEITWTYDFTARRGAGPAVRALAPLWRRYARQIVARCVAAVERAEASAEG